MAVADPVSWLMIRPGWKVLSADGAEVGRVDEVTGDETLDIFDGLAVATSALGKPRYVPAESVSEITDGAVRLSLSTDEVEALGEYSEPATTARIEADSRGGLGEEIGAELREVEGKMLAPIQTHERSISLWRRIVLCFRRRRG